MLYIIVCDDEKKQKDMIMDKISKLTINRKYIIKGFENSDEMMEECLKLNGEFIFIIDIVLKNQQDGIKTAKIINEKFKQSIHIYITSYLNRVTDIFNTDPCYFIYKPELDLRLHQAINKAIYLLDSKKKKIVFHSGSDEIVILVEKIYSIERIKRYSLIHCEDKTYKVKENLQQIYEQLPQCFEQCHRCYIVNFQKVKMHTKNDFILANNSLIPISRNYKNQITEKFQIFLSKEV